MTKNSDCYQRYIPILILGIVAIGISIYGLTTISPIDCKSMPPNSMMTQDQCISMTNQQSTPMYLPLVFGICCILFWSSLFVSDLRKQKEISQ